MIFLEQLQVYHCYTDNNTVCLEGYGVGNLLPICSLQVYCYPEWTAKVRHIIKAQQPRGRREAANGSCTSVLLFTLWPNVCCICRWSYMECVFRHYSTCS